MENLSDYKAWFEKYRPQVLDDLVLPNSDIKEVLTSYWDNSFVRGNILSYGPAGFGKTALSEILIRRITKDKNDIFILGRKTDDVDNLRRWLQQQPYGSSQKIVKIEEMDRLSTQAQVVLKDGLMEKFQHNTTFLATTNSAEKIDPALLTRFNTKINFSKLPVEGITHRLKLILDTEKVDYLIEDLTEFVQKFEQRGLRDLINNLELASTGGKFVPSRIAAFSGVSENETHVIQYVTYLVKLAESMSDEELIKVIKDPKANQQFYTYYEYTLRVFKSDLGLNWHLIYTELSTGDLDMSSKNIINDYWQDLDLKRFKTTHTVSLIHELLLNIASRRGIHN